MDMGGMRKRRRFQQGYESDGSDSDEEGGRRQTDIFRSRQNARLMREYRS